MRRVLYFAFILSIIFLISCSNSTEKSKKVVIDYLELIMGNTLEKKVLSNGEIEYDTSKFLSNKFIDYKKVLGFQVIGYEIVNVSENLVSAKITFRSKAKTDIYRTHSFKIENGIIVAIDGDDGTLGKLEYEKEIEERKQKEIEESKILKEKNERLKKELERLLKEKKNRKAFEKKDRAWKELCNKKFSGKFKIGSIWRVKINGDKTLISITGRYLNNIKYKWVEEGSTPYDTRSNKISEFSDVHILANNIKEYRKTIKK